MAFLRSGRSLLLLAYTFLALGLLWSNGLYHPVALLLVTAGFAALLGAWKAAFSDPDDDRPVGLAVACLVVLLLAQLPFANAIYLQSLLYDRAVLWFTLAAAVAVALAYGTRRARWSAWRPRVFAAAFCGGLAVQWLIPWVSPEPFIDVYVMLQESARALLAGQDPYTATFFDIYGGQGISKPITTYTYPPANILLLTPFFALLGDVRFGMLAANLITILLLWRFARCEDDAWAELLVLLFVFHPRAAFTIEQSWVDPLILGVLSLALLLREQRREGWSAAAYGVMLAMKQYLVFFLPLWWLLERRPTYLLLGVLAGLLTVAPFLVWHPGPAVHNGLLFHLSDAFRPDSLTLASFVYHATGMVAGRWLSGIAGIAFSAAALWTCRALPKPLGFVLASAVTFFALFFLGSQGFCNYYMLASGVILLAVAAPRHDRA